MNVENYILSKIENIILLESAVSELAETMGHTTTTPLSTSLLCLELGLNIDERDKLISHLSLLSEKKNLDFSEIRAELESIVPKITDFSDDVLKGMVEVISKNFDLNWFI